MQGRFSIFRVILFRAAGKAVIVYVFGMQLFSRKNPIRALVFCLLVSWQGLAVAHPIPDVPVRTWFSSDGSAQFEVELDLRCFVEDPLNEPFVVNATLQTMDDAGRSELMAPALPFFAKTAKILFDPSTAGETKPQFIAEFGKVGGGELIDAEDPVAVMLRWKTKIPEGVTAYRLNALESGELSVRFLNHLDGIEQKRVQVLFPGETSKPLNLTNIAADAKTGAAPARDAEDEAGETHAETDNEHSASTVAEASATSTSDGEETAQQLVENAEQSLEENNRQTLIISAAIAVVLGGIGFALAKR